MRAFLHGVRRVDMTSQDNGRPVRGFTCFLSFPSEGVQGEETDRKFVSDDLATACAWSPAVGHLVDIDCNLKGKLCGIATVREK